MTLSALITLVKLPLTNLESTSKIPLPDWLCSRKNCPKQGWLLHSGTDAHCWPAADVVSMPMHNMRLSCEERWLRLLTPDMRDWSWGERYNEFLIPVSQQNTDRGETHMRSCSLSTLRRFTAQGQVGSRRVWRFWIVNIIPMQLLKNSTFVKF